MPKADPKYAEIDNEYRRKINNPGAFERFQERAAIIEFEGDVDAKTAAALAFRDVKRNPAGY